jgi:hypothetical protein
MSVHSTVTTLYFAKTTIRAWDTQSLPMMVKNRVYLIAFEPRMLGEIWKELLCKRAVLIA